MLGLGLSDYAPGVIYGVFIIVAFLTLFYKNTIGVLFISFFLPIYSLLNKVIKSELPLAKDIIDILVITMLLGWFLQSKKEEGYVLSRSPLLLPIFLFVSYSFWSFIQGTLYLGAAFDSDMTMERLAVWKNYMIMPLLYIITYYTLKERKWKYALFILLFFSFLIMDYKFRQTFRWVQHTHYFEKSRLGGTIGFLGPNEWGGLHTIYTLFLIGLFMIDKHVWRRLAYAILIGGGTYCLMYSFSRGAYVGFLVGLFFIAFVRSKKLLIPLILFLIIWKSVVPLSVVERIEGTIVDQSDLAQSERTDLMSVGGTELDTAKRAEIWSMAWNYFSENPISGIGFRTFMNMTEWDTHNVYLKMLTEQGLIGLALYLWLYVLAWRSGWRLYRHGNEELLKAFGFAFLCAVVGSIVVNFFGDRWMYLQIGGLYWIFWAIADQEYSMIKATKGQMTASLEDRSA